MFKVNLYDVLKALEEKKHNNAIFQCRGVVCFVKRECGSIILYIDDRYIVETSLIFGLKSCYNEISNCIFAVARYKCVEIQGCDDCISVCYDFKGGVK